MQIRTQVRADWRVLLSAAFIGSGVGLALGGGYLAGGLGPAAADHSQAVRIALDAGAGFSQGAVRSAAALNSAIAPANLGPQSPPPAGLDPDAKRVAAVRPTRARELDCLAQAVYFEARGESPRGQQAVATVIMNRVKNPSFPKTVCGVVYQGSAHHNGCQFSFACDGLAEHVVEANAWDRARKVAARVLSGAVLRDIGSATHFHTTGVDPDWGSRMLLVAQVGLHVFYRFNPHAPRVAEPDDDATAVFASSPAAAPPQLRLAEAMVVPLPDAGKPASPPAEAKPAAKAPEAPPAGISKTDAATPAKPETSTTS